MRLGWIVVCGAACGTTAPEPEPTVLENRGRVCVVPTNPGGGGWFYENELVGVQFRTLTSHCFSSSCSRDRSASCAIVTSGTMHHVTTLATWTDISEAGIPCTADCVLLDATCETSEPLPAGNYTFVFGERTVALTIPSQFSESLCAEN